MNQDDNTIRKEEGGDAESVKDVPGNSASSDDRAVRENDLVKSSDKKVDLASIDALPPESDSESALGEYVRDGTTDIKKKDIRPGKNAELKPSPPPAEQKKDEEDFVIPVLRTYQSDTRSVAETKGGAELRTILAKEAEEKKKAQKEYLRKTKNVMKESAALRDSYVNFSKQQEAGIPDIPKDPPVGKEADAQQVAQSVSGALSYVQSARAGRGAEPPPDSSVFHEAHDEGSDSVTVDAGVSPDVKQTVSSAASAVQSQSAPEEKKGVFSKLRGRLRAEDTFSQSERNQMRRQQEEIVKKESIKSSWKDFQRKKQELHEQGFSVRDVRSYSTSFDTAPSLRTGRLKQGILVGFVVILVGGLIFLVASIALQPHDVPGAIPLGELRAVRDVVSSENKVFVDISATPDTWPAISQQGDVEGIINKFVPYEIEEGKSVQIGLDDFNINFIMRIPPGLRETLGDYYFVGNYVGETRVSGIFIISVKNYGDALVWMLNWEKNVINSFTSVFPGLFNRSNPENTSVVTKVIDNKDVRILQNPLSDNPFMYYFFNRSILVFVAGDEGVISIINSRIRSANAQ